MKIALSNILTAFSAITVGSKVLHPEAFIAALLDALEHHDTSKDRTPGQHFVVCPRSMFELVSGGVGPASSNPDDYVLREWRGDVMAFLHREKASPVNFLACVVYTREAYLNDPEVTGTEREKIGGATHVLVAVLAGDAGPVQPGRLVYNLAGANHDFDAMSGDEIRKLAKESSEYWSTHNVVADALSPLDRALSEIEQKILDKLKGAQLLPGFAGFVSFLLKALAIEDHVVLEQFEKERDNYTEWLIDIMVKSGRYKRADDCQVELIEAS